MQPRRALASDHARHAEGARPRPGTRWRWACAALLSLAAVAHADVIQTFGGNLIPAGPATNIGVGASGVAIGPDGNVYFADSSNHAIRKVDRTTGVATVIAGTGLSGYSGDDGPATAARLNSPKGIAFDSAGNIYIADTSNHRIRRITVATGVITTIAGTGTGTFGGDNAAATAARVNSPQSLAVQSSTGDVYIADTSNNRIRKITVSTGNISTVAGNGTGGYLADNVAATSTRINAPRGVVVDDAGNFWIADTSNNRIRKVDTGGTITTVAGTGTASFSGDNGAATSATIRAPQALTRDSAGNMFIADTTNHRVRRVDGTSNVITTLAGTGTSGYNGDGIAATTARLSSPAGIAVDADGNVYVGDTGNLRVRTFQPAGNISTYAGTGSATYGGDGGLLAHAQFTNPQQIAWDSSGRMYLSDSGSHRIRRVDADGIVTTIAGTGVAGFSGDDGQAAAAQINTPLGMVIDPADNLYFADGNNNRVRKIVLATGVITTFAGDGTGSFGGDNGAATSAQLFGPFGVAIGSDGTTVYITDTGNNRIRKVVAGTITTIAGDGTANYGGDGGLATAAQFNTPVGIALDAADNIFVTDYSNGAVRKITASTGIITTVAGNGANGFGGDGGLATAAQLNSPRAVAVAADGTVYITDTTNSRIRKVDPSTGIITTIAGDGNAAFSGDGGPPAAAQVSTPQAISVDSTGVVLYIGDTGNRRYRRIVFADPPDAPTIGTATAGDASASIAFTAPADDGGIAITGYTATANPGGATSTGCTASPCTVSGLVNGVAYTFTVAATNLAGTGAASSASGSVTPQAPQSITFGAAPAIAVDTTGTVSATGGGSGNAVVFSSQTTGVCTVSGSTVTGVSAGTCTIAANQAGSAAFEAAPEVTQTFAIAQGVQTIAFGTAPAIVVGSTGSVSASGGASGNAIVFTSQTPAFCTVSGSTVSGVAAGTCTIAANQAGNANYAAAAEATQSFAIGQGVQTIAFGTAPIIAVGGSGTVSASGGASGNAIVFTSQTPASCTVIGSTVAGIAAGTCTIAANQTGNANYAAAAEVTQSFAIGQGSQLIVFGVPPSIALGGTGMVAATGGASGNPVVFTSLTTSVCTVSEATVTAVAAGTCTIAANQAGNADYTAAPQQTQSFGIGAGSQTITFGAAPSVTVGGIGTVSATGGASGNPIVFTSLTTSVCTVSGTTVTGVAAGTCTIAANQAGNADYTAAPQQTQSFGIGAGSQAITFGTPPSVTVGGTGTVSATGGGSGNPVVFTSLTTSVCAVSNSTVTGVAAGTCTIAANQAGNADYLAAPQQTLTFAVGQGTQTIVFDAPADRALGSAAFGVAATGGASGNPVQFASQTTPVCTTTGTNGATITLIAPGTCTIRASQAGNANYLPAVSVDRSFNVTGAVPSAPQTVAAVAGNARIDVTWTAPASDGGTAIVRYTATASTGGASAQCIVQVPAAALGCAIVGLQNGQPYQVAVTATNAVGTGPAGGAGAAVTPFAAPGAPTQVQATTSGSTATISWIAPASNGGRPIESYTVTATPGGQTCTVQGNPPPTTCTITGLDPNVTYTFMVTASNGGAIGPGGTPSSAPAVIPASSPAALLLMMMLIVGVAVAADPLRRR